MKLINILSATLMLSFSAIGAIAQDITNNKPFLVHTMYLNTSNENRKVNVDSVLEIFKKRVLEPNQFYISSKIVAHWYGPDSRQVLVITEYKSWDDIVKSEARQNEIIGQLMKDKTMDAVGMIWESLIFPEHHSDEIFRVVAE